MINGVNYSKCIQQQNHVKKTAKIMCTNTVVNFYNGILYVYNPLLLQYILRNCFTMPLLFISNVQGCTSRRTLHINNLIFLIVWITINDLEMAVMWRSMITWLIQKGFINWKQKCKNRRGHSKGLGLKTFSSHWRKLTFSSLVIRMCSLTRLCAEENTRQSYTAILGIFNSSKQ